MYDGQLNNLTIGHQLWGLTAKQTDNIRRGGRVALLFEPHFARHKLFVPHDLSQDLFGCYFPTFLGHPSKQSLIPKNVFFVKCFWWLL